MAMRPRGLGSGSPVPDDDIAAGYPGSWPRPVASPPPSAHAAHLPPRPARWRYRVLLGGLIAALAGLAISMVAVAVHLLPRTFSAAQQQQIIGWEIGKRWRAWSAGRIFPATVPYQLPAASLDSAAVVRLDARRVGIAPQASCHAATDRAAWRVLARHGCQTVLRATYLDSTGTFAITVGVAVLPGLDQASGSGHDLPPGSGVRVVRFSHTLVAGFGAAARQLSTAMAAGPYLIMSTVGYADGRHHVRESADPYAKDEMLSVADGISQWIGARIGAAPPSPHCPGGPAC
ncbi:MAG: hypothetical protein ACLPKI_19490 [Streptosporangiaceae bacterium]